MKKTKDKDIKWEKHLTQPYIKILDFLRGLELFLHE